MDYVPIIVALIAAIPGVYGLLRTARKADADTVEALSTALQKSIAAQQVLQDELDTERERRRREYKELSEKLTAAYTRIDELKSRERELLTTTARLEAKVELLSAQVTALGGTPITGLDSDPGPLLEE